MGVSEEWKALLEMGRKDLRALILFESSVDLADEIFGFHAQQAAEKALKAWISRLGGAYPPTHDLSKLIPILERSGIDVASLWGLTRWNSFAVQFRYDGLPEDADPLPRREIIATLERLFSDAETVIPATP
jgi:HEPN domain-containing protein